MSEATITIGGANGGEGGEGGGTGGGDDGAGGGEGGEAATMWGVSATRGAAQIRAPPGSGGRPSSSEASTARAMLALARSAIVVGATWTVTLSSQAATKGVEGGAGGGVAGGGCEGGAAGGGGGLGGRAG